MHDQPIWPAYLLYNLRFLSMQFWANDGEGEQSLAWGPSHKEF